MFVSLGDIYLYLNGPVTPMVEGEAAFKGKTVPKFAPAGVTPIHVLNLEYHYLNASATSLILFWKYIESCTYLWMNTASSNSNMENTTINIQAMLSQTRSTDNERISKQQSAQFEEFSFPTPAQTFKGREKETQELTELFFEKKYNKIVLHGPAGFGKSELAKHFALRCQNNGRINRIVWINAGKKEDLKQVFQKQLESVDASHVTGNSTVQHISENSQHFVTNKYLIIFDDVFHRQCIIDLDPPNSNNCFLILITTREKDWGDDVTSFQLNPLTDNSALEVMESVLTGHFKKEEREVYKQLLNIVDKTPLGVNIVGAFVRERIKTDGKKFCLKKYVEEIKTPQENLNVDIPQNETSLYNAVRISLNKITEEYKDIRDLILIMLFVCSHLHPKFLYLNGLLKITDMSRFELVKNNICERKLKQALLVLHNYSFFTYDSSTNNINMNTLIQKILRFHLKDCHSDIRIKGYRLCLEFLLPDKILHISNILKYADDWLDTFNNFYEKLSEFNAKRWLEYKAFIEKPKQVTSKCHAFLNHIKNAHTRCNSSLKKILFNYNYESKLHLFTKTVIDEALKWNAEYLIFILAIDVCLQNDLMSPIRGRPNYIIDDFIKILYCLKHDDIKKSTNSSGHTLLHMAAASYNYDLVEILLNKYKMDPNKPDLHGTTPFHKVFSKKIETKHASIIEDRIYSIAKDFINFGALLNIKDSNGQTPYELAQNTNLHILLVNVQFDDMEYLQKVLDMLDEQNVKFINDAKLLQATIDYKETDMFKFLLQYDVDIYCKTYVHKKAYTLLHSAVFNWDFEVMELLIQRYADTSVVQEYEPPLFHAFVGLRSFSDSDIGIEEINKALDLLKCQEYKNITDNLGNTLLHYAALSRREYLIKILVEKYQMDINAKNNRGWTPLFCLINDPCICRHQEIDIRVLEELKKCGARLDVVNNNGDSPIQAARRRRREYFIPYLTEDQP